MRINLQPFIYVDFVKKDRSIESETDLLDR